MSLNFNAMPIPHDVHGPLCDAVWGARTGKYSFVISADQAAYHASWKNQDYAGHQPINVIDGSPFASFVAAEKACKETHKQLRAMQ